MNVTVLVSNFRDHLTDYLELLQAGRNVVITDARKGKSIIELTSSKPSGFDWDAYIKKVQKLAGSGLFVGDESDRKKFRRSFNLCLKTALTVD